MSSDKKFYIKCRAIILHQERLLLVKHPHDPSFAALPGGHLEWGEDPKECLVREIVEELGIKPEIGRLLYINTYIEKDVRQLVEFFFEVKNGADFVDCEKLERSHAKELAQIVWVDSSDNIRILPKTLDEDFRKEKILSNTVKYIKS